MTALPGDRHADPTRRAVAGVVQTMVASRLGRAFLPLLPVVLFGAVQMALRGPLAADYAVLALGGLAAGASMLLYGNGAVRRALGRRGDAAAWLGTASGLVAYAFAFWLLGFRGLRPVALVTAGEAGAGTLLPALLFVVLAARILWDLSRLTELHRLARTMTVPAPEEGR